VYQELEVLRDSLSEYVQATYHLSHPTLVELRRQQLAEPRTLQQSPWVESSARYQTLASHDDLAIPEHLRAFFRRLVAAGLAFPPYTHQGTALERVLGAQRNDLVVTTGTGSGKTETFLHPVLGRIYDEAYARPERFATRAIRALVLYPMNALVNDQLGRLRTVFGSPPVREAFVTASGRPLKFARYTGRTLFPGLPPKETSRLATRLKPLKFYLDLLEQAAAGGVEGDAAASLIKALQVRGRWPAKPDLETWYNGTDSRRRWYVDGELARVIERPDDSELLLRSEVHARAPDLFMTNYSMLEYTLLRPIERPIWSQTAAYYADHRDERMLLVLDEAHLYRGASGTEVAMLIRRMKARLDLQDDQLQVICTSASFDDSERAREFAAALAGRAAEGFIVLTGEKRAVAPSGPGDALCDALATIDARACLDASPAELAELLHPLFEAAGVQPAAVADQGLGPSLFALLNGQPVIGRLLNLTSGARAPDDDATHVSGGPANEVDALSVALFPSAAPAVARRATDTLLELAAAARPNASAPPLLAARVHAFYRALPGVWACMNPDCCGVPQELRGGPTGALSFEPRVRCSACGARVFELHTCRDCGLAVAVGYARDAANPEFLWPEPGGALPSDAAPLHAIHLAVEEPAGTTGGSAVLDTLHPETARLGCRTGRDVWRAPSGTFEQCPRCRARGDKISGHATAGDQPFQVLVTSQLTTQPPVAGSRTPLRGRKVMIFSDGRQAASRLAGNLKSYSLRDALRPLLLVGAQWLRSNGVVPTVDLAFPAVVIGCALRDVSLPVAATSAAALRQAVEKVKDEVLTDEASAQERGAAAREVAETAPPDVLGELYDVLFRPHTGLEALGLATFRVTLRSALRSKVARLAPPSGSGDDDDERRQSLLDLWLRLAAGRRMVLLPYTPEDWLSLDDKPKAKRRNVSFDDLRELLPAASYKATFAKRAAWPDFIEGAVAGRKGPTAEGVFVDASTVELVVDGVEWTRCALCTRVQPASLITTRCVKCKAAQLAPIDPASAPAFRARAGGYRSAAERALLSEDEQPFAFVAEEHSAQLGRSMDGELFALNEEYELRFQDVALPQRDSATVGPVDVLSCTTTMEVGIDIGSLTGVALRNVPPGRANYQQRAGRAGRRGSSLATVLTWCGADSHDRRFFHDPAGMISGPVEDPHLDLGNLDIVRRHAFALVLSMFQLDVLRSDATPTSNLFMSLGEVDDFRRGPEGPLSYRGLARWLRERAEDVRAALRAVLPAQHDEAVLRALPGELLTALEAAGCGPLELEDDAAELVEGTTDEAERFEEGEQTLLLGRLFAKGLLPKYAFPTDVVSFHVFKAATRGRRSADHRYAPQQSLTAALSQYAPGREVWIDGLKWRSFGLYDPFKRHGDRWTTREAYVECQLCGFAKVIPTEGASAASPRCDACQGVATLSPPVPWMIPVGFCQPYAERGTVPGEKGPPRTRTTTAKLDRPIPSEAPTWCSEDGRISGWASSESLTLTNTGTTPLDGKAAHTHFQYCARCGRIEPNGWRDGQLSHVPGRTPTSALGHARPAPPRRDQSERCDGFATPVVLGTRFQTDVAVFRLRFAPEFALVPGAPVTRLVLTTLAEAVTAAARALLDLDRGEVAAEHRPALTPLGPSGQEVELYVYDTVPGGAGYSRALCEQGDQLFHLALHLMERCVGSGTTAAPLPCDKSCYSCLRSYGNRWLHGDLDRELGAAALRHAMTGEAPRLPAGREGRLLREMSAWLNDEGASAQVDGDTLIVDGRLLRLRHPMAQPQDGTIDALLVERALPDACAEARTPRVTVTTPPAPPSVVLDPAGAPMFGDVDALCAGAALSWRVRVDVDAPADVTAVALSGRAKELLAGDHPHAEWAIVRPSAVITDKPQLMVIELTGSSAREAFHGTGTRATMAVVKRRRDEVVICYKTTSRWGRTETLDADEVVPRYAVLEVKP